MKQVRWGGFEMWKHIIVEGYCLLDIGNDTDIPRDCFGNNREVGFHCLAFGADEHKFCPHFGFTQANSTVVLTDNEGEEIIHCTFEADDVISNEKEWNRRQEEWIENWKNKIAKCNKD